MKKLSESFDVSTNHLVLIDADVSQKNVIAMTREFKQVDGVQDVLSLDSLLGSNIPRASFRMQASACSRAIATR